MFAIVNCRCFHLELSQMIGKLWQLCITMQNDLVGESWCTLLLHCAEGIWFGKILTWNPSSWRKATRKVPENRVSFSVPLTAVVSHYCTCKSALAVWRTPPPLHHNAGTESQRHADTRRTHEAAEQWYASDATTTEKTSGHYAICLNYLYVVHFMTTPYSTAQVPKRVTPPITKRSLQSVVGCASQQVGWFCFWLLWHSRAAWCWPFYTGVRKHWVSRVHVCICAWVMERGDRSTTVWFCSYESNGHIFL